MIMITSMGGNGVGGAPPSIRCGLGELGVRSESSGELNQEAIKP
jgi:hypothetical protein